MSSARLRTFGTWQRAEEPPGFHDLLLARLRVLAMDRERRISWGRTRKTGPRAAPIAGSPPERKSACERGSGQGLKCGSDLRILGRAHLELRGNRQQSDPSVCSARVRVTE